MPGQKVRQTGEAPRLGITRDAGIDNLVIHPLRPQTFLQKCDPAGLLRNPILPGEELVLPGEAC